MAIDSKTKRRLEVALTSKSAADIVIDAIKEAAQLPQGGGGGGGVSETIDDDPRINWASAGETSSASTEIVVTKQGSLVHATVNSGNFTKVGGGTVTVANVLPSGYRPIETVAMPIFIKIDGATTLSVMHINSDGSIVLHADVNEGAFGGGEVVSIHLLNEITWLSL